MLTVRIDVLLKTSGKTPRESAFCQIEGSDVFDCARKMAFSRKRKS